jgi:hypothetical protein
MGTGSPLMRGLIPENLRENSYHSLPLCFSQVRIAAVYPAVVGEKFPELTNLLDSVSGVLGFYAFP